RLPWWPPFLLPPTIAQSTGRDYEPASPLRAIEASGLPAARPPVRRCWSPCSPKRRMKSSKRTDLSLGGICSTIACEEPWPAERPPIPREIALPALLRVAVIGCGYFATNHLNAWRRLPDVEIAGVCDLDAGKARRAAERFGAARWFADAAAMLDEVRPD